ncbi:MAG: zinc ABC transporter substrate-binding protein [Candidatus Dormibacteraeota bacterium]|nr:zinc ABC transporter substrate-binding protein [Candidatus Dormibacteraeota bacterium]
MRGRLGLGRTVAASLMVAALTLACTACGGSTLAGQPGSIKVVAGENFWGSMAIELGGSKVNVQSVVTDPNADPHSYESSTNDARAFADADLVILNGAGYDDWGQKLLAANASKHRRVMTVAKLLSKKAGDNPHFWYDPDYVVKVADQITSSYRAIDSADASYFEQKRSDFGSALPYLDRLAEIKAKFGGKPIGSTESIFVYMANALSLALISPPEFMQAVSEGNDPPANAVAAFHDQITGKGIKVLVYNVQTATSITTNLKNLATVNHIPVVGISETLQPETATFQDWQLGQLVNLENALTASMS